jgi:hypothetical protein
VMVVDAGRTPDADAGGGGAADGSFPSELPH